MCGADFEALVDECLADMGRAIEACNREWDFQGYQRWDVNLDRRVLVFSDGPRPPIECDIQVVGNYMTNRDVWRWSWDNSSIEPALWAGLEPLRAFGAEQGIPEVALGGWEAKGEDAAWAMTALAVRFAGAISAYRAPDPPRHVFLIITAVRRA